MRLKKLVSIGLIAAMSAALFAGCGGSSEEEVINAQGSSEEEEEALFDDMQEIDVYAMTVFSDAGSQEVEDAINEISEAEINVHVNLNVLDVTSYMQQVGLMLSGGEKFDLLMCTAIPSVSFGTMQSQNELLDISEYLDEYAPETKELMSDYLAAMTVDGAIYGVPSYRLYNSNYYILMRKDILDQLGLTEQAEAIDSWSDYEAIMEAVANAQDSLPDELKTNSMLVNADSQGTVINCMSTDFAADAFADCYGFDVLGDGNKLIYVDEETDTVECYFASDDYRATVERVHDWMQKGYIYKDAAISDDAADNLMKSGLTFSFTSQSEYGVKAVKEAATGYELVSVEVAGIPIQTTNGNAWGWSVPTTSDNPEAAVAFMNLMYTNADIENLLVYGIEGRDYELNDAGEACLLEDKVYQSSDFLYGNQFNAYPSEGSGSDFREKSLENMESAEVSKYFGLVVSTGDISNELTAISAVLSKYEAGLESGSSDPDEVLDQMLSELDAAGLQTVLDYYQNALDAWLAEQ